MSFDLLTSRTLIERFEPYFKHPDPDRPVIQLGDRTLACKNAKAALCERGYARALGDEPRLYDHLLLEAVTRFQTKMAHRNVDGAIGPGTRSLLVSELLRRFGVPTFAKLDDAEAGRVPTVFLSYAWVDASRVDKLDQWLRDHGVCVIRDITSFEAGSQIKDNIWKSVLSANKVIAVYSENSKSRDWPTFEHQITEQVEKQLNAPVLIYLRLDKTPLRAHDAHRIAIDGQGKALKQIGLEIQKALGNELNPARVEYDEDAPI
jgi:hypothetical protein